jgi:hypothetical protein
VSVLANAFGQELLPAVKAGANLIDSALSGAGDPTSQIRQRIQAIGQGLNSLVTGQGAGTAQFNIGASFGPEGEKFFTNLSDRAEEVRSVIKEGVIPAVQELV